MTDFKNVVASSRIRLARNLNGYPFPSRLKDEKQAKQIIRTISSAINRVDEFELKYMDGISEEEALNLVENHLVSPLLIRRPGYSAVIINARRNVSIMINEEDHLREQCIEKGFALREAYATMSEKDALFARLVQFAYDERLGFLTACPTNLGTGLRASVMLFLPALTMAGAMQGVVQSATRLGLTVRGIYGEGSLAEGYMYQVSNEVTLGVREEDILTQVEEVVSRIAEMEQTERAKLMRGAKAAGIKDACLRAYGVLTNCALMSGEEFEKLCANLKLGACLGYYSIPDISDIDELIVRMKPSNLNLLAGRSLSPAERDAYRADVASKQIKKLTNI
ncbi:MAG: ATP--guanido phosphotransferase [Candidatus Coproplasma sp.]